MNLAPSATGPNGDRDSRGRFAPGNKLAVGNPHARRVAQFRTAMFGAVTEDDLRQIAAKLAEMALAGDTTAAKLLLGYLLGRPSLGLYQTSDPADESVMTPEQVVRALLAADLEDRIPPGLRQYVGPVKAELRGDGAVEDAEG